MTDCLIIGGDGLIGGRLARHLAGSGGDIKVTTRRPNADGARRIHLDLSHPSDTWPAPLRADVWVICAAISRFADCRADPVASRRINIEAPEALARIAFDQGAHVVFLSTNQVFDGRTACRAAEDTTCPESLYGKQKAAAEGTLQALGGALTILRMTKIIDPDWPLINGWVERFDRGLPVQPYADMTLAPVAIEDATEALAAIVGERRSGIFQISGPRDITYADAARHIADRLGAPTGLIQKSSAAAAGVPASERPLHTALDARRLESEFGLHVAAAGDVLDRVYGLATR